MKYTRCLSITLTLCITAALFTSFSCQSGETQENTTTVDTISSGETESLTEATPELPERNFDGYTFTFLNGNTSYTYNVVTAEEQNGDTINDAIYQRNLAVEELYNIQIEEIISTDPQGDYNRAVTSQDDSFDIALLRMEWAFPVVLENQAVNWSEIPNLNLDQPYWVQGSISSMSLMNDVYFAVSLFDLSHFESVRGFIFNKDMVEDMNLESPYYLVREGRWTIDKLHEMSMTVSSDLDNDGNFTMADRYGIDGYSNVLCNTLMCGVGSILSIGKDEDDLPYVDLDNDYNIERLLAVSEMFGKNDGFVCKMEDRGVFRDNKALFGSVLFSEVAAMRDVDINFGIIPTPKYNEEQTGYINLGGSPFFMVVPQTVTDCDRTGAVMEALARTSEGVIDVAYYDIVLKGKSSRDDESVEMLDIIFSTLEYYHPLANSYLNAPLADTYIFNGRTDFASYFASVKDSINTEIDEAIELVMVNQE